MLRPLLYLTLLPLVTLGCGPLDPCESSSSATLELGGGLEEFVPLGDPPALDLVYGPQGGVHVEVSLLARGLDATSPWRTELRGYQGDNMVGASLDTLPQPACQEDRGGAVVSGLRLIFEDWVRPANFDEPIKIEARVWDQFDSLVEAEAQGVKVVVP